MPIVYERGDIFNSQAQAIVVPVSANGVVRHRGVAFEAYRRYPAFRKYCESLGHQGLITPGTNYLYENYQTGLFICVTRQDPDTDFNRVVLKECLHDLVNCLNYPALLSWPYYTVVAMPALGCGAGGLLWAEVKPMIESAFSNLNSDITLQVYEPHLPAHLVPDISSIGVARK